MGNTDEIASWLLTKMEIQKALMIKEAVRQVIEDALKAEARLNPGSANDYVEQGQRALERGEGEAFVDVMCQAYAFNVSNYLREDNA